MIKPGLEEDYNVGDKGLQEKNALGNSINERNDTNAKGERRRPERVYRESKEA